MSRQYKGKVSKELLSLCRSIPTYYACMAVKRLGGIMDLAGKKAEAAKCYGELGVVGWTKFRKDVCEHTLPEWLTYSLMGRTSKDGEVRLSMVSQSADWYTMIS